MSIFSYSILFLLFFISVFTCFYLFGFYLVVVFIVGQKLSSLCLYVFHFLQLKIKITLTLTLVRTSKGPSDGSRCVFPFSYDFQERNECLPDPKHPHKRRWCATTYLYNNNAWGYCNGMLQLYYSIKYPSPYWTVDLWLQPRAVYK